MASIVVNGDTSGAVTLSAPATAGTVTVTLPATSGTMLTTASSTGVSGSAISSGTVAEAYGGTGTSTGYYGFKNRIINGAMVIAQRGTTATSTNLWYPADRFRLAVSNSSKVNLSQSTTAPTGFVNSILATSLAATTVGAAEAYELSQQIEGYNIADFGWGTASAKTVTLSFWVRSSLTGTFGGTLENSGNTRAYPFSYTISSANTWEQKFVTIAGDTTGTWLTNNGRGITVIFGLGSGSNWETTANAWNGTSSKFMPTGATSVVGTNGATWYVTGVQLEEGSTPTSFEYRQYGTELALCQRYYEQIAAGIMGFAYSSTNMDFPLLWKVTKRAAPTISLLTTTITTDYAGRGTRTSSGASILGGSDSTTGSAVRITGWSSLSDPGFYNIYMATNWVAGSAEL